MTTTLIRLLGTLKFRLVAASMLAVLGATSLAVWQIEARVSRDAIAAADQREHVEARRTAAVIGRRVAELQRALAVTAHGIDAPLWSDAGALRAFFESKPVLRAKFANIAVIAPDGQVRLVVDGLGVREAQLSVADRPYFQRTLARGEPVVSDPVPGRISAEPVILLTQPITADGRILGVMAAALRLASRDLVSDLADDSTDDDPATVIVTDRSGTILAHPLRDRLLQPLGDDPAAAVAFARWRAEGQPKAAGPGQWSDALHRVGMASDATTGWHVWRVIRAADITGPLQAARNDAMAASVVMACAAALLLGVALVGLLRPLDTLQRKARALMSGDDSVTWPEASGEIGELVSTLRHEVARRVDGERAQARVRAQLDSVMAAAPVGIAFTRERRFELVSDEMCRLMGLEPSQLQDQPARVIFSTDEDYQALGPQVAAAFGQGRAYEGDWPLRRGDGRSFWARLRARPVVDGDPAAGTIWSVHDITEQRATQDRLEHAARHDPLTGLLNREGFDRAVAMVPAVATPADGTTGSIIMIDLDRFKPINDTAGHAAGDAMLQAVARVLASQVRSSDLVARIGGDEFAVLLPGCDARHAEAVAEKIRSAVAALALTWSGRTLTVGASLGVAERHPNHANAADWCAAADAACYESKRSGRNSVRVAGRAPILQLAAGGGN
jgi:diguanylate cyclase (GGDEF)-like protein/PAS domain S-box-containing protein